MIDIKITKSFHALIPDLQLSEHDKDIVRTAIIIDSSNYEHFSWTNLNDEQVRIAIQMMKNQIARFKKS